MNFFDRNSIHLTFYTICTVLSAEAQFKVHVGQRGWDKTSRKVQNAHTGQKTEREDLQLYSTTTYYAKWYNKEQFRSGE